MSEPETDPVRRCPSCKAEWTPEMLADADKPGNVEIKCSCGETVATRTMAD